MRITTRVSIGLFLMVLLLVVSMTYQLSQVERLQRINGEVSLINMEGARISLRLLQAVDGVQEFAAKYQILPDSAYRTPWREWERAVDEDLRLLRDVGLADEEEAVREKIETGWARYREASSSLVAQPVVSRSSASFPEVQAILAGLSENVEELIAVNDQVVAEQATSSAEATDHARSAAWIFAAAALALAALLSFLLYRSISGPIRRLTRGTREIARGRFDHRLRIQGPRELSSLAKDFDRMAARLDELENLKRDFVSHVSHELKTPLAAVQETIEVLLDGLPGPLTPKQVRLLELSRSSSGRLSSMIADLLETSRLEAGAAGYLPTRQDIAGLVRSVLDEMEPLAIERGLRIYLRVETPETEIVCDRNRMREVVANLVNNAVKFSPEEGKVRLVLSEMTEPPSTCPASREVVRGETGPFVLMSVEDEGPGVPDRDKDGIFEKFHQVRRGERLRGQGVGLGLAISLRVVEAHQGAIWVEDGPRSGSVFRVLLPRVPSQWADENLQPSTPREAESPPRESAILSLGGHIGKVALGLLAAFLVSACAAASREEAPEPLAIPEPVEESVVMESPPVVVPQAELHISTGWSFVATERYEEAYTQFLSAMKGEGTAARSTGEAVWGMAILYLLPESPYFDPAWAGDLLGYLQRRFPKDALGIQATWVRGILSDLSDVRVMVAEQEEALRRLTETVDQLKNIDLNRSPSGATGQRSGAPAPSVGPTQDR
jgi:two-component system sensor histidine kinase GlrK